MHFDTGHNLLVISCLRMQSKQLLHLSPLIIPNVSVPQLVEETIQN